MSDSFLVTIKGARFWVFGLVMDLHIFKVSNKKKKRRRMCVSHCVGWGDWFGYEVWASTTRNINKSAYVYVCVNYYLEKDDQSVLISWSVCQWMGQIVLLYLHTHTYTLTDQHNCVLINSQSHYVLQCLCLLATFTLCSVCLPVFLPLSCFFFFGSWILLYGWIQIV